MRRRTRHDDTEVALANFALTLAKALLVVCFVAMALISDQVRPVEQEGVKPNVQMMMILTWPGEIDADVDIWIKDPTEKLLYYANQEVGFLTLERDDIGSFSDSVKLTSGDVRAVQINEEIISVRGFVAGEYIVNVHLYNSRQAVPAPFPVRLRIERLNPSVKKIFDATVHLTRTGEEMHVVRFRLAEDGTVSDIDTDRRTSIVPFVRR